MLTDLQNPMQGIKPYGQQLTDEEILNKKYRDFVGGLWEEIGVLQFEFLKQQGLLQRHNLIDIGCGALRV